MKTESNEPINSVVEENNHSGYKVMEARFLGLTKREYFAAIAMQGLIAANYSDTGGNCKIAVQHADALIEALNL